MNIRDPQLMEIAAPSQDVQALATQAVGRAARFVNTPFVMGQRFCGPAASGLSLIEKRAARSRPFDAAMEQAAIELFAPVLRALIDSPLRRQPTTGAAMSKPKKPKPRPRPAY
jgi:hypothetical protein